MTRETTPLQNALRAALVSIAVTGAASVGCSGRGDTPAAPSGPGSEAVERARTAVAAGDLSAASDALAEAARQVEEAGPLRIVSLALVEDSVRGYGLYDPRASGTIRPDEPLLLYFEPVGFKRGRDGDRYAIDLAADLAVLDAAGTPLQRQDDFLVSAVESRRPNREIQFVLRLALPGVQEGDFIAEVTLKDRVGGKKAIARKPFRVRLP